MSQLLTPILSFLLIYKYSALFAITLIGNIIFFLPSNFVILMVGVFSNASYFNFYWSLLIIVLANVLGDLIIYQLAKKYPQKINQKMAKQKFAALERLKKFMKQAAGPTIIISRFSGSSAIIVNALSGLSEISSWQFLLYDLIGNLLVAGVLLYLGFIIGSNWEEIYHLINTITIVLGLMIIAFLIYKAFFNSKKKNTLEKPKKL